MPRITRWTALAVALIAAATALLPLRPPPVRPADAPATEFSAARASRLVADLTRRPHPVGSAEHRRVRDAIAREIAALGLEPEIHRTFVAERRRGRIDAVPVTNLLARLPGSAPSGTLLALAHYDAVPGSPGAGDDAAGVAALLETMRALVAERRETGTPLAEDVLFLITDAEELGLHGARAFAAEHPAMADVRMVLNVEARGAAGVSILFETGPTDAPLMRRAAAALDRPYGNSFSADVYRFMPNDTDFSPFRDRGLAGFNFAFIGDYPAYHAGLDSADRLDPRSLQHHGDQLLALTRAFAGSGFGDLPQAAPAGRPATPGAAFLTLPFAGLLAYPTGWTLPLAVVSLLLFAAVAWVGRRRLGVGRFAAAVGVAVGGLVAALAGAWLLSTLLDAAFDLGVERLPPSPWPEIAWTAVALALAAAPLLAARRLGPLALGLAGALPWLVLTLVAAVALPASQQLFVWPLLATLAGLLALARERDERAVSWLTLGLLLVAVVATLWIWVPMLPLLALAFPPLAPLLVAFGAAMATVLLAGPLVLFAADGERWWPLPAVVGGVAVVALAVVVASAGYGPERPRPDGLFYALDADAGEAVWVSFDPEPDGWTGRYLGDGERRSLEGFFQGGPEALAAPAPRLALEEPVVELLEEEQIDEEGEAVRRLRLAVSSPRGAEQTWVRLEAPGLEVRTVGGIGVAAAGEPADVEWVRTFADSEAPGAAVEIEVDLRAGEPLAVSVVDREYGLPELPGEGVPRRPEGYRPARFTVTDLSMVKTSTVFPP